MAKAEVPSRAARDKELFKGIIMASDTAPKPVTAGRKH